MSETHKERSHHTEHAPDFSHYEASADDITHLREGVALLRSQHLLEEETLKGLRFVTFDAQHIYLISEEEHHEVEGILLEELLVADGLHVYKIPSQFLGSSERNYYGAGAWLELPEIDQTAAPSSTRVLDPTVLDLKLKKEVLKVVYTAPEHAFQSVNTKGSDYFAGLIAHEAAHIEEMRYRDWPSEGDITPFPSRAAEDEFKEIVRGSNVFPPERTEQILHNINRKITGELYAFAVERESLREQLKDESPQLSEYFKQLADGKVSIDDKHITELLSSSHVKAYALACAFEEVYPDYGERMAKLRELIKTKEQ